MGPLILIIGFFVLVVGLLLYSFFVQQPRMRQNLEQNAAQRGWTYTPGAKLVVTQRTRGHLISPNETVINSLEGTNDGISWRIDAISVAREYLKPLTQRDRERGAAQSSGISYHTVWQTEAAHTQLGSVLLFVKPEGWGQAGGGIGATLMSAVQGEYQNLVYDILRRNWGINSATLDIPALNGKYRVEGSDLGAATATLTPTLLEFLTTQQPPVGLILLGSKELDIVVGTDLQKTDEIDALVRYGAQLAKTVNGNQQK